MCIYSEYVCISLFLMCIINAETKLHSCVRKGRKEKEPRNSKDLIMRGRVGIFERMWTRELFSLNRMLSTDGYRRINYASLSL